MTTSSKTPEFIFRASPEQHTVTREILGGYAVRFALRAGNAEVPKPHSSEHRLEQAYLSTNFTLRELQRFASEKGRPTSVASQAFKQLCDTAVQIGVLPEPITEDLWRVQPVSLHWVIPFVDNVIKGQARGSLLIDFHDRRLGRIRQTQK